MAGQMLAYFMDLKGSGGPFKGKKFKFHLRLATGERKVMELGG